MLGPGLFKASTRFMPCAQGADFRARVNPSKGSLEAHTNWGVLFLVLILGVLFLRLQFRTLYLGSYYVPLLGGPSLG